MSKQFAFNVKPNVSIPRSMFDLSHSHKTTMNVGDLVPIDIQEIYPGDTFKTKTAYVVRSTVPFIRPVMDNLFMDINYFFVPHRLTYNKFKNVMGENTDGYWANTKEYKIPTVLLNNVMENSIPDHLGIPVGNYSNNLKISALPFRAYALIWNEWFRDQNTQEPVYINVGDIQENFDSEISNSDYFFEFGNNEQQISGYYDKLAKVNKFHDYFTSALPGPQKGDAVEVPIGGLSPVRTSDEDLLTSSQFPINFRYLNGGIPVDSAPLTLSRVSRGGGEVYKSALYDAQFSDPNLDLESSDPLYPSNLYTDYGDASLFVNDLRFSFALQKMLERDARSGTRYVEYVQSHFNVQSPDATQQRPEFLGGKRTPLFIQQVNQTSQGTESSPLAQVGANSLSNGIATYSKSFTEHGFVIALACIRYHHSYQQGIEKFWFRDTRISMYDPVFANIGEQPITKKEIFAYDLAPDNVFGYQEAWCDLRYRPSKISGALASESSSGLDIWHFGDYYENSPVLSAEFIQETPDFVDRTLSAPNQTIPNFILDFYHKVNAYRPLPLYSIPGLVDHH